MRTTLIAICVGLISFVGCVTNTTSKEPTSKSSLTHGNVQLTLKKGETTQQEVIEIFGAPNIATVDGNGNEVWTYQRHAIVQESSSASSYGTIILFGGSSRSSGFEQSSRTMTLIIKFDKSKKVIDFKSMYTSF